MFFFTDIENFVQIGHILQCKCMCTLNCTLKINRVLLICCVLTVSFGVKSKSTVLSSVALGLTGDFERELQCL